MADGERTRHSGGEIASPFVDLVRAVVRALKRLGQEPLARRADEHAVAETCDVVEAAKYVPVLRTGLCEADTRIDDQAGGRDSCRCCLGDALTQFSRDLACRATILGVRVHFV